MRLTVGMAHHNDLDGALFSIQALALYHPLEGVEIIVVDNDPSSGEGESLRQSIEGWRKRGAATVRYIPMPEAVGTTQPRQRIFDEATGDIVISMDCHVLIAPGALERLVEWCESHPDNGDILGGPMLYNDLRSVSTHFEPVWRSQMYGTWDTDPRGLDPDGDAFEIPGQGLGLFACRKDKWLGFNPHFRGFGGEELYIHEKFRQAGRKALCLPFLRWWHRFERPRGVRYPLNVWNKVRNYVLGHQELGLPLDPIYEHFVRAGLMPEHEWRELISDPVSVVWPSGAAKPNSGCGGCGGRAAAFANIDQAYEAALRVAGDIEQHLPKLRELATGCAQVVELGVRTGVSTTGLLAGKPKRMLSIDKNESPQARQLGEIATDTQFSFVLADSRQVDIPECDLLFIDTFHAADCLWAELSRHAGKAQRIAMHDTAIFGEKGEDGSPGLLYALRKFLREHPEWSVIYDTMNQYGLTVISRRPEDKPSLPGKVTMAANFAKAIAAHVADGLAKADAVTLERRLEICSLCPHRVDDRCSRCGCFLVAKAEMRASECPIGKWGTE